MYRNMTLLQDDIILNQNSLYPDFIDNEWTEPNQNPVIFEWTYSRLEGTPLPDKYNKAPNYYVQGILGSVLMPLVISGTADTAGIALMDAIMAAIPSLGMAEAVGNGIAAFFLFAPYAGPPAAEYMVVNAAEAKLQGDRFYQACVDGKNEVDSNWWIDPETGERVYAYDGCTVTMEGTWDKQTVTVTQKSYQYDNHKRYIETTSQPMIMINGNTHIPFRPLENIEGPDIEYF